MVLGGKSLVALILGKELLYPFQKEGVEKMKSMEHVLLFDDMGLGKTVQAIWHVEENNLKPCLVICPNSVKLNWWDEIYKWTGDESYYAYSAEEVPEYFFLDKERYRGYYIIHHEALAYIDKDPRREGLMLIPWKSVIIDEAHQFRNPDTSRTENLMKFRSRTKKFIILTGTPMVNSPFDLYPILSLIGMKMNRGEYLNKFTWGVNSGYGYKPQGGKNVEELQRIMSPYYIKRMKSEVLKDLPPKTIQKLKLTMPKDQRKIYDNFLEMLCLMLDDGCRITSNDVLSQLLRLRQLNLDPNILGKNTSSSKTMAILELLENSPKEKFIISSTFKQYVDFLASKIENAITYDGDDRDIVARHKKIERFRDDPNCQAFIMTVKTGGVGLNLQFASKIILTDLWWNSATNLQVIDRVFRIGQKNPVICYILDNENSIDQHIAATCAEKESGINEVVTQEKLVSSLYRSHRKQEYSPSMARF